MLHSHLLILVACLPLEAFGWVPSPFLLVPRRRRDVENRFASPNHHHHQQQQPSSEAEEEIAVIRRYYCYSNSDKNESLMFDYQAARVDEELSWRRAAEQTWNWCQHFVVPYNLCPWAAASVAAAATAGAIQIYVVPPPMKRRQGILSFDSIMLERTVHYVANDFYQKLRRQQLDPNTAIAFVVVADGDQEIDFGSFYEWFIDLEDRWLEAAERKIENHITLAPFHPDWHFGADDDEDGIDNDENLALDFEKKSPYPTISIVSAEAIDKAGEAATQQIGINNAKLLQSKSVKAWEILYDQAIRLPTRRSGGQDSQPI